jgi:hypothetical protein
VKPFTCNGFCIRLSRPLRYSAQMTWGWVGFTCCVTLMCAQACERDIEQPGQLIVAIDTDMALPDRVDTLHLEIQAHGELEFQDHYDVGPQQATVPATLVLVSRDIGDDPVTVRVAGSKSSDDGLSWQTFREAITRVPHDRIATLRMPLQWLCKGQVEAVSDSDGSPLHRQRAQSTCGNGNTCRAGKCEASDVDGPALPDYAPADLYGGGDTPESGSCFDTVGCMDGASPVTPDADCTIETPRTDRFNVALRVIEDGICAADGADCYVPLNANDPEGWSLEDDRVRLPPAVCEKLSDGSVRAVLVSDTCKRKTAAIPACGAWSEVPEGKAGEYRPHAVAHD